MTPVVTAHRLAGLLRTAPWSPPVYHDLAERLRALIVDGRLSHGDRLPSERALAAQLDLSRTTVTAAYETLRGTGLLVSRRGSGSTVQLPFAQSSSSALIAIDEGVIPMTHAAPPAPAGLGAAYERAAAKVPSLLATSGYLPDGLPVLRERLAERMTRQGIPTSPEQILITSGAQSALMVVARWLISRGDRVLTEALVYPHLTDLLGDVGARVSALPHGASPWDLEALAARLQAIPHRAAFLTVDFHNPTGALMAAEDRERLAWLLRRFRVQAVIDETIRDVVLDDIALPPSYAAFDDHAIVIGSASKSVWGGLRLGWIRAASTDRMALIQARLPHDLGAAAFEQLVLAEVLADPEPIMAAGQAALRENRAALLGALESRLPEFAPVSSHGGLNVWARLPSPASTKLSTAARRHGVAMTPGPRFAAVGGEVGERHVRLPYALPAATLTEAIARIARAWESSTTAQSASRTPGIDVIV